MSDFMRCVCEEGHQCRLFDIMATKNTEDINIKFTTYLVGHCGYWMMNALNISTLLLIEGYAFGRLQKSFLSKVSLFACCTQICSCTISIMRYNMMEERGSLAPHGTMFSAVAFTAMNISYLFLMSTSRRFVQIGSAICILVGAFVTYLSYTINPFVFVQYFVATSQIFSIVGIILGSRKFEAGIININVVSRDSMSKIFKLCIFLNAFSFAVNFLRMPLFYVFLGLSFSSCAITMAFVGTSDYMSNFKSDASSTSGERQPINV
mmetsp:Transcript_23877/g.36349  ORF Transcript_23877/g.36349 Transcript_23877/m.36349 type:complete len:264 (-) Transcript_23877:140-931(-)